MFKKVDLWMAGLCFLLLGVYQIPAQADAVGGRYTFTTWKRKREAEPPKKFLEGETVQCEALENKGGPWGVKLKCGEGPHNIGYVHEGTYVRKIHMLLKDRETGQTRRHFFDVQDASDEQKSWKWRLFRNIKCIEYQMDIKWPAHIPLYARGVWLQLLGKKNQSCHPGSG